MKVEGNAPIDTGTPALSAPGGEDKMGKAQFLELLVAQISHQDPLNPMDDKALVSQLAQFTSVEQAIETNSRLDALVAMGTAQERTALSNLIGKGVRANTDQLHFDPKQPPPPATFQLAGNAEKVEIHIRNEAGELVRSLDAGALPAGRAQVKWDGRDASGRLLPAGSYRMDAQATDAANQAIGVSYTVDTKVTGVAMEGNQPTIMAGQMRINSSDILAIYAQNQDT